MENQEKYGDINPDTDDYIINTLASIKMFKRNIKGVIGSVDAERPDSEELLNASIKLAGTFDEWNDQNIEEINKLTDSVDCSLPF